MLPDPVRRWPNAPVPPLVQSPDRHTEELRNLADGPEFRERNPDDLLFLHLHLVLPHFPRVLASMGELRLTVIARGRRP